MCVHVIRAVLRVVLDDEDGSLWPEFRMADGIYNATEREIVLANVSNGRGPTRRRAVRVIVGQADDLQARHFAFALEAFHFRDEAVGADQVRVRHVEAVIPLVHVTFQAGRATGGGEIGRRLRHEFAIAAIRDASGLGAIPNVAAGGRGDGKKSFGGEGKFFHLVVAVGKRPHLFHEVGGVRSHAPFVAVGADFGICVKIIQQHKVTGQPVLVRRDALRENAEARIAVAQWQVAKDLIVGAIFLHDVDTILDRTAATRRGGNRVSWIRSRRHARVGIQRTATLRLRCVTGELALEPLSRRNLNDAERPAKQATDVFHFGVLR